MAPKNHCPENLQRLRSVARNLFLELISGSNKSCGSGVPMSGSSLHLPRAPVVSMTGVLTNSPKQNNCCRWICIGFPKHRRVREMCHSLMGQGIRKNGVAFCAYHNMKALFAQTLRLKMSLRQPPHPLPNRSIQLRTTCGHCLL